MSDVDPIEAVERALREALTAIKDDDDHFWSRDKIETALAALPALVALREERDALSDIKDGAEYMLPPGSHADCEHSLADRIGDIGAELHRLRARVRDLEALCGTAAGFIDYGHDPDDDSKVDNIRAALRAASRGAQP